MATYYVATTGSDSTGDGSSGNPWRTIQYGAEQLIANDTLLVGPGTYTGQISLNSGNCADGSAGNLITIAAEDSNDRPIISNNGTSQFFAQDLSYWKLYQLDFRNYTTGGGVYWVARTKDISNVTIEECHFEEQKPNSSGNLWTVCMGSWTGTTWEFSYPTVKNCNFIECRPRPTGITAGNEVLTLRGNVLYGLVEGNYMYRGYALGINLLGVYNQGQPTQCIVRDNYVNVVGWLGANGTSCIYNDRPGSYCVIEKNICETDDTSTNAISTNFEITATGVLTDAEGLLIRNNVFITKNNIVCALGIGNMSSNEEGTNLDFQDYQFHHNVAICKSTSASGRVIQDAKKYGLRRFNNILLQRNPNYDVLTETTNFVTSGMLSTWESDGNMFYSIDSTPRWKWSTTGVWSSPFNDYQSDSGQDANGLFANPIFADEVNNDYLLNASSPGVGAAIPVALTTNSGSSSVTLNVDNPSAFTDGNGIQAGDDITVGGTAATISSINRGTGVITLDSAISWSIGDDVYYAGADDIGLYELAAGSIVANFTYSPTTGVAPSTVIFTDTSTSDSGIDTWSWNFGDGSPISTTQNPTHEYVNGGTYTVTLTITGVDGTSNISKNITITEQSSGSCNNSILVNGDFSSGQSPWTFSNPIGIHTVQVNSNVLEVSIDVLGTYAQLYQFNLPITSSTNMILEFDAWLDSGTSNLDVALLQHLSPYSNLGLNQTVSLTSSPPASPFSIPFTTTGSTTNGRLRFTFNADEVGKTVYFDNICLSIASELNVSFTTNVNTGAKPLTVNFTDTSTSSVNITNWLWDFGDGSPTSVIQNPTHIYTTAGTYTATLVATDANGDSFSASKTITVIEQDTSLPNTSGSFVINSFGTVTQLGAHPSWIDVFTAIGENKLGQILLSYNIFSGLGEAIEPITDVIIQFNIDTGNYIEIDENNTIISAGNDTRLMKYGAAHPIPSGIGILSRGQGYWDWWQAQEGTNYVWPSLLESQYTLANNL